VVSGGTSAGAADSGDVGVHANEEDAARAVAHSLRAEAVVPDVDAVAGDPAAERGVLLPPKSAVGGDVGAARRRATRERGHEAAGLCDEELRAVHLVGTGSVDRGIAAVLYEHYSYRLGWL
jgi:hypothetical protein